MLDVARTLVRLLDPSPGSRVAVALSDAALLEAVSGLLETAGVETVEDGGAHGCIVEVESRLPFVPRDSRQAIGLVSTGGTVVAVAGAARVVEVVAGEPGPHWGPRLRATDLTVATVRSSTVFAGKRSPTLSNQMRRRLRAIGHGLDASVLLGRAGLTKEVVQATQDALQRHGIVKVKLTPACEQDKAETLGDLAWSTGAQSVQRVGRTAVLYRGDVRLEPPVKRGGRR